MKAASNPIAVFVDVSSPVAFPRPNQRRSKTENENENDDEDDWENQPMEEHNPEIRPFRRLEEEGTGSLPSTFLFRMNSCGGHTQTPWPQSSVKSVKSVVYLLSSVFGSASYELLTFNFRGRAMIATLILAMIRIPPNAPPSHITIVRNAFSAIWTGTETGTETI